MMWIISEQAPDMIIFHSPQNQYQKTIRTRSVLGVNQNTSRERFWKHYEFQKNYWQRQGQGATILYSLLAIRKSNFEGK